ncbi:alanyl-tRNA synthetase [Clostridium pascui]|uniref:alanyl-tRNA editing protein n=1 Tax=Clostridium pascui TaxID=46609 RepID=UPI00195F1CAA|nr:alanyl-tRNA editing protein [Clostridium pascui]MBM7869567.1 alanyl-tRNA synthetase [Clostridium pascui]
MEERLYYTDPYIEEWNASIKEVFQEDGKFYVILDRTAFFPGGGGQPEDRGVIDGLEVKGVFEREKEIVHVLEEKLDKTEVKCKLDFSKRFYYMQQHAGEHLLSAVLYDSYGTENNGFHMGDEYITIDNSIKKFTEDMINEVEKMANYYIYKDIPIIDYFVDYQKISDLNLRKKCTIQEDIRIVEIEGIDRIACCGTHVRTTGQIGLIKIIKTENYKGMTRIYFKCGQKAFQDYQQKHKIVATLNKNYSSTDKEILDKVTNESLQVKLLSKQVKELKEKLMEFRAKDIIREVNNLILFKTFNEETFEEIQIINRFIMVKSHSINILVSEKDKKVILSHDGTFELDCGKIFKENISKFQGKGGGGHKHCQGSFLKEEDLNKFSEFLSYEINKYTT